MNFHCWPTQTSDKNKICQQDPISLACCKLFTASQCQLMFESFSFTSQISESSWSWSLPMQLAKLLRWQKEEWILIFMMKDLEVCCRSRAFLLCNAHTPNANMADHSVGTRDESNESEASEALMFCFHNAFPGKSCFVVDLVLSFALPTHFCVPECHRNRVESSTAEEVLFFQFSRSPLRENQRDGGKEFTVQVGINLRKCVSDRIYLQVVVLWLNA